MFLKVTVMFYAADTALISTCQHFSKLSVNAFKIAVYPLWQWLGRTICAFFYTSAIDFQFTLLCHNICTEILPIYARAIYFCHVQWCCCILVSFYVPTVPCLRLCAFQDGAILSSIKWPQAQCWWSKQWYNDMMVQWFLFCLFGIFTDVMFGLCFSWKLCTVSVLNERWPFPVFCVWLFYFGHCEYIVLIIDHGHFM